MKTPTIVLTLLAVVGTANVASLAADIPWADLKSIARHIWRGEVLDGVGQHDLRFQVVRNTLLELGVRDTVGYITELGPGEDFTEDYYLTQYALVPIVVASAPETFQYVIGNFKNPGTDLRKFPDLDPIVVTDDGVVLFRRKTS